MTESMLATSGSVVNGSGYLNHNERKFTRSNVDKLRIKDNVVLKSQTVEETYQQLFSDTIEVYNANQKIASRRKSVDGYLKDLQENAHKKGAEKPFYEVIVQIGDMYDCNCVNNPNEAERAKQALTEYFHTFQERNPNLKVFHATIHMDEQTPHLHLDYIPIAEGCYKQGMQRKNSLSKALELQGLGKHKNQYDNAAVRWQEQERKALKEIAKKYDFEIVDQGKSGEKHLSVQEFKEKELQRSKEIERLAENIEVKSTFGFNKHIPVNELTRINRLNQLSEERKLELNQREEKIEHKEKLLEQEIAKTKAVRDDAAEEVQQLNLILNQIRKELELNKEKAAKLDKTLEKLDDYKRINEANKDEIKYLKNKISNMEEEQPTLIEEEVTNRMAKFTKELELPVKFTETNESLIVYAENDGKAAVIETPVVKDNLHVYDHIHRKYHNIEYVELMRSKFRPERKASSRSAGKSKDFAR